MLWDSPSMQTMLVLESPSHPSKFETQVLKEEFVSTMPGRRGVGSTSPPLKTLCASNPDHYSPLSTPSLSSNLDSIIPQRPPQLQFQAPPGAPTDGGGVVNTLPSELLCLIFESYLEPSSSTVDNGIPSKIDAIHKTGPYGFFSISREYLITPVPLTHVCQSWRHAAIGHRNLWSSVALAFTNGHNLQGDEEEGEKYTDAFEDFELFVRGKIHLLSLFLHRALDGPLSISFSASVTTKTSCSSFNRDLCLVHEAFALICRYSRTWKSLRIELGQGWGVETFLESLVKSPAVIEGGFDSLESLHLELAVSDEENGRRRRFATPGPGFQVTHRVAVRLMHLSPTVKDVYRVLLRRSPYLTDLTLDDTFFTCAEGLEYDSCTSYQSRCPSDDPHREFVRWTQLTNLSIHCDSISTRKVLAICSRTPKLETLTVRSVGSNGSSEVDCDSKAGRHHYPSSISLSRLRSLDVTFLSGPGPLFAALVLGPLLATVEVNMYASETQRHLRRFGPQRRYLLREILGPLDRMLETGPSSSRRKVELRCSVDRSCIDLDGTELDATTSAFTVSVDEQWMEENGLNALVRCGGKRVVEVFG